MTDAKRPREFWIDPTPDNTEELADELDTAVYIAMDKHPGQGPLQWQSALIKVIEYSAVQRLEKELEHAANTSVTLYKANLKLSARISKLREAMQEAIEFSSIREIMGAGLKEALQADDEAAHSE